MKYLVLCLIIPFLFSCTRQSSKPIAADSGNCENTITVSSQKYNQTSPNSFTISKCDIKGDCLEVTITTSGCSGSTWTAEMISNGMVAESYPPQMFSKILFTNKEACLSIPSRKFSFNIKPLRVSGVNKVSLNLEGWSKALLYEY